MPERARRTSRRSSTLSLPESSSLETPRRRRAAPRLRVIESSDDDEPPPNEDASLQSEPKTIHTPRRKSNVTGNQVSKKRKARDAAIVATPANNGRKVKVKSEAIASPEPVAPNLRLSKVSDSMLTAFPQQLKVENSVLNEVTGNVSLTQEPPLVPSLPLEHNENIDINTSYDTKIVPKSQPKLPTTEISPTRMVITNLVLTNFKSYAGRQIIGPFHKV